MFSGIRRLLGNMHVKQTQTEIIVSGIPAAIMARDISRIWGTSRITTNMFSRITNSSLSFPLFFAPDVVYALGVIMKDRYRKVSIRFLNELTELLLTETWLADTTNKTTTRLDLSRLSDLKLTPLDFQMEFINTYNTLLDKYDLKGYLLAGAAGSGKTLSSLYIVACLKADLVIIVSPKNAVERVWENSIKSLFVAEQTYWLAHEGKELKGNERFIVGHYEAIDAITNAMLTRMKQLGSTAKITVILDESHNLNEIKSLRTQRFIDLCDKSKSENIIWLSGTPIKALGSESLSLFRCIDKYFTQDVEERFRKIYGKDATKGLDILKHRLGLVSFKVEKSRLKLLDPIIETIKITIPNGRNYTLAAIGDDMRKYVDERLVFYKKTEKEDTASFYAILDKYESIIKSKEEIAELNTYRSNLSLIIKAYRTGDLRSVKDESVFCNAVEKNKIAPMLSKTDKEIFLHTKTLVKYMSLKVQGECLGRVLGGKRIQCHVDMVKGIDFVGICESTAKKTIVFTSFVDALKEVSLACTEKGLLPTVVYGGTNSELTSIIQSFEKDKDINPLIATYNSLSTAVPLVMADTMIMLNMPFRDYIYQQAISRIHRLDSDTQTYVYLIALDTGDEPNLSSRSTDILKWSQSQIEKIMGIKSPFEITEDLQSEGLENYSDKTQLTISTEDYGIEVIIPSVRLGQITKPIFSNW